MYWSPRTPFWLTCTQWPTTKSILFLCCDSLEEIILKIEVDRIDEDLNSKEDRYRQIKGEYMKKSLPECACELKNSLFLVAHTNTSSYLQPAGQQWVYITWRKACVSAWNGVKWSWNWCCWSSSVPSGHGSLPRNDCTLQTHPQGKILDLTNY